MFDVFEHLLPEDKSQSHGVPYVEQGKDVTIDRLASRVSECEFFKGL